MRKRKQGRAVLPAALAAALICCALPGLSAEQKAAAAQEQGKSSMRVNADQMELDNEEGIIYLKGHVVVRDPKGVLAADNATVYLDRDKKKAEKTPETGSVGSFSRIVAVGNVKMSSSDKIVLSDKAVWTRKDNIIVLTGGPPMVRQGVSYVRATRIVYNVDTRNIQFYPEPEMVFQVSAKEKARFIE